jgi:geranylgeranyl diphosphate synthase type I
MRFNDYSKSIKEGISSAILAELDHARAGYPSFSGESAGIFVLLEEYSLAGKMLRGVLACLSADLFRKGAASGSSAVPAPESPPASSPLSPQRPGQADNPEPGSSKDMGRTEIFKLAAALELLQAGLLIHDDIMDEDSLRRGMPTMHKRFEREAVGSGARDPAHLGESLALCAGDICYFSAWNLLSGFGTEIQRLFSQELAKVCLAQARDVRFGARQSFPALDEILEVYAYKTARYTICLPLMAGALASGRPDALPLLEDIGLNLGLIFQLKDDYLGLFGDESRLGKPVGSDLREGKKTPYMILLRPLLSDPERQRFDSIFGNDSIRPADVDYLRSLILRHDIDKILAKTEKEYSRKAQDSLSKLLQAVPGLDKEATAILKDFVEYSLSRNY